MTVRTQTLGKLCCICDSACQTLYVGWLPCLADFPVWPPAHKGHSSALLLILRGRLLLVRRNLFPALSVSCTELEDAHNFLCSLSNIFQLLYLNASLLVLNVSIGCVTYVCSLFHTIYCTNTWCKRRSLCNTACFGKGNDPTSSENQSGEILADNQDKA